MCPPPSLAAYSCRLPSIAGAAVGVRIVHWCETLLHGFGEVMENIYAKIYF